MARYNTESIDKKMPENNDIKIALVLHNQCKNRYGKGEK